MNDLYKDEETKISEKTFESTRGFVNQAIFDPKARKNDKLDEKDQNFIITEISMIFSEVPETALNALKNLYIYFFDKHVSLARFLKDEHIRRLVDLIQSQTVGFMALQCINLIFHDRKKISDICVEQHIFDILKNVIFEHMSEDDVLMISFDLLAALVKKSKENRNTAYASHLYDDINVFYQREREYLPSFLTFVENSLIPMNYPPSFYQYFTETIINMFMDEEYQLNAIECVNLIGQYDEQCITFFQEPLICEQLIKNMVSDIPPIRVKSIESLANALSLDASIRDLLMQQDVIPSIINSISLIDPDQMGNEQLIATMDFIIQFILHANDEIFPFICDVVNSLDLEVFLQECQFDVKKKILYALRIFVQYAKFGDLIVEVLGNDACEFIASLLDPDESETSYDIIMFVRAVVDKVQPIPEFENFRETVSTSFLSTLEEMTSVDDKDTADQAHDLVELLHSIIQSEE